MNIIFKLSMEELFDKNREIRIPVKSTGRPVGHGIAKVEDQDVYLEINISQEILKKVGFPELSYTVSDKGKELLKKHGLIK